MKDFRACLGQRILSASFVILALALAVWAQTDPNPDSPTPVLISENNSLRALAMAVDAGRTKTRTKASFVFYPNQRVVLYATNLALAADEGAAAFRLAVQDAAGKEYRFPVVDIQPLPDKPWVYAITVELRDTLGFWNPPAANGDLLVGLTWRGLKSNRVRLGYGNTGGTIKDDVGAVPTPLPSEPPTSPTTPDYSGYLYSGDRTRFMEQATFGPTTALDLRLRRIGLRVWIEEQFNASYPTIPYPNIPLMPSNITTDCSNNIPVNCVRDHYSLYPVQTWFFKEAFYGDAQLRHRVAWALSQLLVISGVDTDQSSHFIAYHKVLSSNAFGNYRTLLGEMTLNPGMGNYLDMARSTKNSPNENYAREILQLFSIGLFMLNPDGTVKIDPVTNRPIPTYDQNTVNNFTKVFTGWGFCNTPALCPNIVVGTVDYKDPLLLNQNNHNVEAKTLLSYPGAVNVNIAANTNGTTELNQALDNIYNHPNVAPFVSRFLIQQLVTSDPTPQYVQDVAAVFTANRTSPTQLKEVIKAILLHPEARGNFKTDPNFGKLREPVLLATNLMRQFGVQSRDGSTQSDGYVAQIIAPMGQNTFYSPTVFNYYTPDYIVPGAGLNGPEFGLLTTGTAISRANFVNTMVYNNGVSGGSNNAPNGTSINLAEMQALAAADASGNQLLDALNARMMHGTMTAQNRATILPAVTAIAETDTLGRARAAIYLVTTSSQYQVQR